jgi:hypothetical protein
MWLETREGRGSGKGRADDAAPNHARTLEVAQPLQHCTPLVLALFANDQPNSRT